MSDALPIDDVLPDLIAALTRTGRAVLQAPPGAGKTTRVPPAILRAGIAPGRIVMLEPRRLAARAAAARMAAEMGEAVGQTVGYRIRGDSRVGPATRIEVVTEGILTRMIQSDPELSGVGAVIFDEFHERSLQADLGLALTLDLAALREDLRIVVMSATLDAGPVAEIMGGAPVVTSDGRAFPVAVEWLPRPAPRETRVETLVADLVLQALARTDGSVLAFLPGEGEIRRTERQLAPRLPDGVALHLLYGTMPAGAQDAALAPGPGRKVVLATNIAETSLTIPDVRAVVDGGLARRARFDAGTGMTRLVTDRVTRAEAAQRAGRAGRVAPGLCLRAWARAEDGAMAPAPAPEIAVGDLAALALDLAQWGAERLPFLTPPPPAGLAAARRLLVDLGALTDEDPPRITPHGRAIAAMPVHPRLAHMLIRAGAQAATLAALLADRDPCAGAGADLTLRLDAVAGRRPGDPAIIGRIRDEARRLSRGLPQGAALSPGAMASLAYPDRIAQRRPGDAPRYLLSGGTGAVLPEGDVLSAAPFLVVTDSDGDAREARVRAALPVTEGDIRALHGNRIAAERLCVWAAREGRVSARIRERLGALVLSERPWPDPPAAAVTAAMVEGIGTLGLRLTGAAGRLARRVALGRAGGLALPDMSEGALLDAVADWAGPWLGGMRTAADWARFDPHPALLAMLDHGMRAALDRVAPAEFTTPLGRRVPVDYDGETPAIEVRLQEMFGVTRHPTAGGAPIRVTLLSPAGRPIQVTTDLPGFWRSSYADVRKDMRGRYPRHPWPEDPTVAEPTLRAKPRG